MSPLRYNIVIDKEPNTDWWATVPSLPGCTSSGETIEELRENIREAIRLYIDALVADGLPVPPSDAEMIETIEVA